MRIYSPEKDVVLRRVFLIFDMDEIDEMIFHLQTLKKNPNQTHVHFQQINPNGNILEEIVVSLYDGKNLNEFDERSKEVIFKGI